MSEMRIVQASAVRDTMPAYGVTSSDAPPASLLTEPVGAMASSGDPLLEIATLLTMADNQQRDASRTMQTTEYATEAHEDAARVQEMHNKASDTRSQGWAEGIGAICSGACGLGAGVTTAVAGKLDWNDVLVAGAKASGGAGDLVGKEFAAAGLEDDARAASHETAAKSADRLAQQAHQDEADARDGIKKAANFLQAVREAQDSSLRAAASYRG